MNYEIIRSRRKTLSIEITRELSVIVRAPWLMSERKIKNTVSEKRAWIEKSLERARLRLEAESRREPIPCLTEEELCRLKKEAEREILPRTEHFAEILKVGYNKIFIKRQKTVWGSCSSLKNLNFNCLLMLCPSEVRDYVIIHELCHLIEPNHSARFWAAVERYCPDYREQRAWLKKEGNKIIERIHKGEHYA